METCDVGTKCRDDVIAELKETLKEMWGKIVRDLKVNVDTSVSETRKIVRESWPKMEQCSLDHPCCDVSESEWLEHIKRIKENRYKIH